LERAKICPPKILPKKLTEKVPEFKLALKKLACEKNAELIDFWKEKTSESTQYIELVTLPDARKQSGKNTEAKISLQKKGAF
jgi:hypothetical protein